MERNDDNGTFFYKLRNGSMPFEYDTEKQLEKIYLSINRNNKDITCGLISAIVANYINDNYCFPNNIVAFLSLILLLFFFLEALVWCAVHFGHRINNLFRQMIKKEEICEIEEEEIQELFYRKIVVQTTYVFSVVKRSKELVGDEDKCRLCFMYSIQGIYGIRKISVELGKIVNNSSEKKLKGYIDVIGSENILKIIEFLKECLKDIKNIAPDNVRVSDEKRIENIEKAIKICVKK